MKTWASVLLVIVMLLSPALKEALSQVFCAEIISGTVDLRDGGEQFIEAYGRKQGVLTYFTSLWRCGLPLWIKEQPLETES